MSSMTPFILLSLVHFTPGAAPGAGPEVHPFQVATNGWIIIQASINDTHEGTFVLDTGGGTHILSQTFFDKISSSARSRGLFTGFRHNGHRLEGEIHEIPSIAIGTLRNERAIVGAFPGLDGSGVDGILSAKLFESRPVSIDYPGKLFVLESPTSLKRRISGGTSIPLTIESKRDKSVDLFITLCLQDAMEVELLFDSGMAGVDLILHPHYMAALGIDASTAKTSTLKDQFEFENTIHETTVPVLQACAEPSIGRRDMPVMFKEGLIYQGLVGSALFKDRVVTIDIPKRRMIVSHATSR